MNLAWVLSKDLKPEQYDPEKIKAIGPAWGSAEIWRYYKQDYTLTSNTKVAADLLARAFPRVSNFFLPNDVWSLLNRPPGCRVFDGRFDGAVTHYSDDIVALNLAAQYHQVVLLLGFDLSPINPKIPLLDQVIQQSIYTDIKTVCDRHPTKQFAVIDHNADFSPFFATTENLLADSFANLAGMLA